LIFPENMGPYLSLDETSLSQGELYTILTNKEAKGKKKAIVAILRGTNTESLIPLLQKLPLGDRRKVKEITMDLAPVMSLIARKCFSNATIVIDRFHVQQLASEALQEIRIKHRWEAIDAENMAIESSRKNKQPFTSEVLGNGESLKQMLARSRHLLYKSQHNWTQEQKIRAVILFEKYPDIHQAYELAQGLSWIYSNTINKQIAYTRLARWYNEVEKSGFKTFNSLTKTIKNNYETILNYFDHRNTNASAESFNAKIKGFRSQFRGVTDVNFFLFRLSKLFA
jgi:transposase